MFQIVFIRENNTTSSEAGFLDIAELEIDWNLKLFSTYSPTQDF